MIKMDATKVSRERVEIELSETELHWAANKKS